MKRRREVPFSPLEARQNERSEDAFNRGRDTPYRSRPLYRSVGEVEALMQTAPHQEVPISLEALIVVRERIQDAIDEVLTDQEREVFDAVVVERLSIRETAKRINLAKSRVDRIKHMAIKKLRAELEGLL